MEVREGVAPFRVAVEAEDITQAVSLTEGGHPGRDVRVVFPIDPEEFFVGDRESAEAARKRSVTATSRTRNGGLMQRPRSRFDPAQA